MPQFRFRLANLLRLREAARDERRVHLADAHRTDAELQLRQNQTETRLLKLQDDYRTAAGPGAVDVSRLMEGDQYAIGLRMHEEELKRQRQALSCEIELRRQALIEADRDVRSLEILRDNQSQAHRLEEGRQEGKRLDEAALRTMKM